MKTIRFSTNEDIMRGIKLIIGKYPILLIDGTTYCVPKVCNDLLFEKGVKFVSLEGKDNKKMIDSFKKIIMED